MKEFETDIPSLSPDDEMLQVAEVLSALRRVRKQGQIDLVFCFMADSHCAVKIFEGIDAQTHLAVAFAQTEYDDGKTPQSPLEIKVESDKLSQDNLQISVVQFLEKHFMGGLPPKINFYKDLSNYLVQKPLDSFQIAA